MAAPPAGPALEIEGLSKRYGRIRALEGVSFDVRPGEIFGYLGPNGAGKTTTLRALVGLVRPDAGRIRLFGRDAGPARLRERIGYLPGDLALPGDLDGRALLEHHARLRPRRPPRLREAALEALGLASADLDRRVKTLSHGTRQKVGIALAIQHDPDLLILDEPTTGLDPIVRRRLRDLLRERAGAGRAVLLSSHALGEVEVLCDRAGVLRAGRLLAVESLERLRARTVRRAHVRFAGPVPPGLEAIPGVERVERRGSEVTLDWRGDPQPLLEALARAGVERLAIPEAELEDVFLSFFGGSDHDRA